MTVNQTTADQLSVGQLPVNQLTIVTGASSGIGAAIAAQAAERGHTVVTVSRRPGPGEHLTADLADPASWTAVAQWMTSLVTRPGWGRVVFIHNAATIEPIGFAGEVDPALYQQNVLVNSASQQVLGERFIAAAETAGVPAQLQLISSGAGKHPFVGWSSYCAAKAACDMWVRTVGLERAERASKVGVFSVGPGIVDTDMQGVIRSQDTDAFPDVERFRSFKEDGALRDPGEVAAALLALAAVDVGDTVGSTVLENGAVLDITQLLGL